MITALWVLGYLFIGFVLMSIYVRTLHPLQAAFTDAGALTFIVIFWFPTLAALIIVGLFTLVGEWILVPWADFLLKRNK